MRSWPLVLAAAACTGTTPPSGPLVHEAYVWRSPADPGVAALLGEAPPEIEGWWVLGAEVLVGKREVRAIALGEAPLSRPLGVVVRYDAVPKPEDVEWAAEVAREVFDRARQTGQVPVGIEVDCDAPTGRIGELGPLLDGIRRLEPEISLSITALPDWLRSPALPELLGHVDQWTLQVHGTELPATIDDVPPLFDGDRARGWIQSADALQRPFVVALPTYEYVAAFRPDGSFAAIASEDEPRWAPGTRLRVMAADRGAVAGLSGELRAGRPAWLRGVRWFRAPAPGDRRTLPWGAVAELTRGEASPERLRWACEGPDPCDLTVTNEGTAPARPLERRDEGFVAAGGVGGWRCEAAGGDLRCDDPDGTIPALAPGERRVIGWARRQALVADPPSGGTAGGGQ